MTVDSQIPAAAVPSDKLSPDTVRYVLPMPEIRILQYDYARQVPNWTRLHRSAPFWRLYWTASPGAQLKFADQSLDLTPDILVLLPPYTDYASVQHGYFDQFYLHFSTGTLFAKTRRRPVVLPVTPFQDFIPHLYGYFTCDCDKCALFMYAILFQVLRFYAQVHVEDELEDRWIDPRIDRAVEMIENNCFLSNSQLAKMLNMSKSNFLRLFKQGVGIAPHRYINGLKMSQAARMLTESDRSIEDIAIQLEFSNRYQFSKAFTAFFNVPPGTYRRRGH